MAAMIRTKRGARRRYAAILRSYFHDFAGGGTYGWDWPTLRLNSPERYAELQAIRAMMPSLPN